MAVKRPSVAQLQEVAFSLGMHLTGVVQFRPFSGSTGEREQTAEAGGLESCTVELRSA